MLIPTGDRALDFLRAFFRRFSGTIVDYRFDGSCSECCSLKHDCCSRNSDASFKFGQQSGKPYLLTEQAQQYC